MSQLNYGLTPKMKPVSPRRSALVVALDIGTSKIACLIAKLRPNAQGEALRRRSHSIEVLGFSHTISHGIKGGAVVDLVAAEAAVRNAVDLAERSAKVQVDAIVTSISAGRIGSERLAAEVDIKGSVTDNDIARALTAGHRSAARQGRVLLHALPIGFSLDGTQGVREPRGMLARRFGLDMHLASADLGACRNLMLVIERCHLDIEAMVAGAYASGLSTLAEPLSARRWSISAPAPRRSRSSAMAVSCMPTASRSVATTSRWIWRAGFRSVCKAPNGSRHSTAMCFPAARMIAI
jgi:cell division protein FtsA